MQEVIPAYNTLIILDLLFIIRLLMEPTPDNATAKVISALIIGLIIGFVAGAFWQERRLNARLEVDSSARATEEGGAPAKQAASAAGGLLDAMKTEKKNGVKIGGENTTVSAAVSVMAPVASGLTVADQPAGAVVQVANISAKEIIWVAVREERDGKAGNILGAQKVFVGDNQKASIDLLRPTVLGGAYHVVVYRDTGSPAFNYREDVVIPEMEGRFLAK